MAFVFVLDASGSMGADTLDSMKRACLEAAKELEAGNELGIVGFGSRPKWVVEIGSARGDLADALAPLAPEGTSDLPRALVETFRVFDTRTSGHGIVVSDGDTVAAGLEASVRQLADKGVTVSAVCVGAPPKFDAVLMSRVAEWGRGRFIFTNRSGHLAKILAQDIRTALAK